MICNCLDPIVRVLCSIIFIERRLGIGVSSFKCDGYSNMIGVEILRIRNTYQKANLKARSNNQYCIVELLWSEDSKIVKKTHLVHFSKYPSIHILCHLARHIVCEEECWSCCGIGPFFIEGSRLFSRIHFSWIGNNKTTEIWINLVIILLKDYTHFLLETKNRFSNQSWIKTW